MNDATPNAAVPMTAPIVPAADRSLTVAEVKGNLARVQALLKEVMVGPGKDKDGKATPGVHYGVIPGTEKPTLLQPGAELILMMFRLEPFPLVEDLSQPGVIRYRVKTQIKHQLSGITLGWGIGECSSDEEKYKWRKVVCEEEFNAADPAMRRVAFKRGKNNSYYTVKQVRTNPADVANTVLKIAAKRSLVGGARSCTAASDVFDQDADDIAPELRREIYGADDSDPDDQPPQRPGAKPAEAGAPEVVRSTEGALAPAPKLRIIRARLGGKRGDEKTGATPEQLLCQHFKLDMLENLRDSDVNEVMEWINKLE